MVLPHKDVVMHPEFIRKYIHYARHNVKPELSDEA